MSSFSIHQNVQAQHRGTYRFSNIVSLASAEAARAQIKQCPRYRPTPLLNLPGVAHIAGVGSVHYKDEASRFGLGSFKALGGAYAVARLLAEKVSLELERQLSITELVNGLHSALTRNITVTCASDGNHGRSVAAGARIFGCRCVIFLHEGVSAAREAAITELGAAVVRTSGNYDDSVRIAADTARAKHWEIISDTAWPGYETVPAIVMQGYGVLVLEILEQLREQAAQMPTHVFLQGGVGGLAATVSGLLWEALGSAAPVFVAVEPESADCLFQSALAGHPASASGDMNTVMAGLACGEVSIIAWEILQACAEFFMTIPDEAAIDSMRLLARGAFGDPPIIAGESATPGLAALLNIASDGKSAQLRMNEHSCALLIGTEGATDPEIYRRLVGFTPRLESTTCGVCA